jgi:hypothetical protein
LNIKIKVINIDVFCLRAAFLIKKRILTIQRIIVPTPIVDEMRTLSRLSHLVLTLAAGLVLSCCVPLIHSYYKTEYPLSQIMHHINGAYTTYFNVKRQRSGHLFQGRFKALLVDADK